MLKPRCAWLGDTLLWAALLLAALVVGLPHSEPLFASLFPQLERPVYRQEPFTQLLWQHLLLVGVSGAAAVAVGTLAGVWVTRPAGRAFRPVLETLVLVMLLAGYQHFYYVLQSREHHRLQSCV